MGGNAITNSQRILAADYPAFKALVLADVQPLFRRAAVPREAPGKDSFGDLDVIVQSPLPPLTSTSHPIDAIVAHLTTKWGSTQVVRSMPVVSLECRGHQVDLIVIKGDDEMDHRMTLAHMSDGDLGAMIGRLVKRLGLRFGMRGLECPVVVPDAESPTDGDATANPHTTGDLGDEDDDDRHASGERPVGWITLSKSPHDILRFLGMDPDRWDRGFANVDDIFDFLATSPFFHPKYFCQPHGDDATPVSNPTASDGAAAATPAPAPRRRRTKLRPMFQYVTQRSQALLTQLPESDRAPPPRDVTADRRHALSTFGKLAEADAMVAHATRIVALRQQASERCGGMRIAALLGLDVGPPPPVETPEGKKLTHPGGGAKTLGKVIKRFRNRVSALAAATDGGVVPAAREAQRDRFNRYVVEEMTVEEVDALLWECAREVAGNGEGGGDAKAGPR
ncbi:hypothetical protein HDU96_001252 [Phlyctochytrium bullatum]|nr:hypothetical protein HDU96_001252 [Phlyctochytrium bullatum]